MTTRNITTLSLITIAILGLNGCGGDASTKKKDDNNNSVALNLIESHSTVKLDEPEKVATVVEKSLEKNTKLLEANLLSPEDAKAQSEKFVAKGLDNAQLDDLDGAVTQECAEGDDKTNRCKEEAYQSIHILLDMDNDEAYTIAQEVRQNDKKKEYPTLVNDGLVKEFTCDAGEVKTVRHYGVEDVFSTANGIEMTSQYSADINQNMLDYNANVNAGFAPYDETSVNRLFLDDINNLPGNVTSGRFYIGLKSNGELQGNDTISLGDFSGNNNRYAKALTGLQGDGWQRNLVGSTYPTTAIYSKDLGAISLNKQNPSTTDTLLTLVQNNQRFSAYVQDDTSVDFITVATCSPKNPIREVTAIVNKFECNEKEGDILKIKGGTVDNFAPTGDASNPATPSSTLTALNNYPKTGYDATQYDRHFIDTLDLGLSSSQVVTKAEFNIGYKSTNRSLWTNDAIYVGDLGTNHAGDHLYDGTTLMNQKWNVHNLTPNYGYVANVNLFDLNNTTGTGNAGNAMIAKNALDVYVQDDTSVDFTQLNLCVRDNCSEDAKEYKIDLSQLASWTTSATDAVENNPIPNVWDNSMNWIEFTTKEPNGHRVLEIPFCACSNTIVNLKSLKADNQATVTMDNNQTIVTQNAPGQSSMRADNNGGVHASGNLTVPAGTNGGTNHTLKVEVTNQSLWFGVAMEGTLNFKGNLGKCNKLIEATPTEAHNIKK